MKFGVRECCDVVLRAKAAQKIGNKIFYKNEPVCYFDTLKTSTLEGAATTVYAQGGRGNARLMSWDGERTVTFTMEDALISPIGLAILTGAGLIEATEDKPIIQHVTETISKQAVENIFSSTNKYALEVSQAPHEEASDLNIYVMGLDSHGEVVTEPYLFRVASAGIDYYVPVTGLTSTSDVSDFYEKSGTTYTQTSDETPTSSKTYYKKVTTTANRTVQLAGDAQNYTVDGHIVTYAGMNGAATDDINAKFVNAESFLVDYYIARRSGAFQVDITPDKFGGSFYLEASTLWRDQGTGQDLPAEFIIPNCRVQSNFTFTMASSGDPSSFTFTMDAFPDYTRYDHDEKVLARIQVIGATDEGIVDIHRTETWSKDGDNIVFGGTDKKNIQLPNGKYPETGLTIGG